MVLEDTCPRDIQGRQPNSKMGVILSSAVVFSAEMDTKPPLNLSCLCSGAAAPTFNSTKGDLTRTAHTI